MWKSRKPFHIRFNEVDGSIGVWDGIRYLVLFAPEKTWQYFQ